MILVLIFPGRSSMAAVPSSSLGNTLTQRVLPSAHQKHKRDRQAEAIHRSEKSEMKARTSVSPQKKTPQKKTSQEKTPQEKMPQRNAPRIMFSTRTRRNTKHGRGGTDLITHTLGSALLSPVGADSFGRGRNTAQLFLDLHTILK